MFAPTHLGTINREFSEITADNTVYCYQPDTSTQRFTGMPINGKIVLQLVDANSLKVEHQNGSCSNNENFNKPTTYLR